MFATSKLDNRLLIALSSRNLKQIMLEMEHIRCEHGQCLIDVDEPLDDVYFPGSCVISLLAVYADGSSIEMATIGREGCTAVQAVLGAETSLFGSSFSSPAVRQRCRARPSIGPWRRCRPFETSCSPTPQAFLEQVLVSVACNGAHSLKQRLARWLLTMRDRSDDDTLQITQNLLAEMLGVHRPTITNAAREGTYRFAPSQNIPVNRNSIHVGNVDYRHLA